VGGFANHPYLQWTAKLNYEGRRSTRSTREQSENRRVPQKATSWLKESCSCDYEYLDEDEIRTKLRETHVVLVTSSSRGDERSD
jgi:Mrp family chromosome partitioning ATPase